MLNFCTKTNVLSFHRFSNVDVKKNYQFESVFRQVTSSVELTKDCTTFDPKIMIKSSDEPP